MGIIQRQGLKNSLVNYVGAGIGMLSTLFVYQKAIDAYGLIQFIKAAALLFLPLANWGIQNLTIRFFPSFRTEDGKHHGFLSFLLIASSIAFFVFALLVFIFWEYIHHYYLQQELLKKSQSFLTIDYLWYFVPLTYLLILVNLLTAYISNFQRIVFPAILHDLFLKLLLPVLILLFAFHYIDLEWLVRIFILAYVVIVFLLLFYLHHLKELHFHRPDSAIWEKIKPMADFAGFSMLGSLGGVMALQLDTVMMGSLDTIYNTGVYNLAITVTTVITIPHRSIVNIAAPIISDSWQKKDTAKISELYQQTSLLLLIAGSFLMLEIAFNFRDLCAFINNEVLLEAYIPVVILGIARIVDMGTSINGEIIQYSTRYRFNIYFIVFLGAINIVLNLWLIPLYGMVGAATATAFSLISFNLLRTIYVRYAFQMLPFSFRTLRLGLIMTVTGLVAWVLPDTTSALFNLLFRGAIIAVLFLGLTYWWKISDQFNQTVDGILAGIKRNT